ncbi:MAG: lyase family protein [Anaerolineales bacterium]
MSKPTDQLVQQLNASFPFDVRLHREDILGSQAWARALAKAGVIGKEEAKILVNGLETILQEFQSGEFEEVESDEDIHTAVERRLTEIVGPLAGKLHTGRSRNDQVTTDFRLWTMWAAEQLDQATDDLCRAMLENAARDLSTPMPGYTHLQHAQAVTFFSTNETVLTALSASFTGLFGLHESTRTVEAMKEGMSESLETLADIGGQIQEAAVKAGYGPTIRADAVKKLVASVVAFQTRSRELIEEMRQKSTANAREIREAVEDGKRRLARLAESGAAPELTP